MLKTSDLFMTQPRLKSVGLPPEIIEEEKEETELEYQYLTRRKKILKKQISFLEGVEKVINAREFSKRSPNDLLEMYDELKTKLLNDSESQKWYEIMTKRNNSFPSVLYEFNLEYLIKNHNYNITQLEPKVDNIQKKRAYYSNIVDGKILTEPKKCDIAQSNVILQGLFSLCSIDPDKALETQSAARYLLEGDCYFHVLETDISLESGLAIVDYKNPYSHINSHKNIKSGTFISSYSSQPMNDKEIKRFMNKKGDYALNWHAMHNVILFANPEFNDFSYNEKATLLTNTLLHIHDQSQKKIEDQDYRFSRSSSTASSIEAKPLDTKTYAEAVYATRRPIDQTSAKLRQTDKKLSTDNSPKNLDPFITSITYEPGDELMRYDSRLYNNIANYKL
jgi:hypothetical protein